MIGFISDWGYNSYYVGIAKSVIYTISPHSVVVDLIHTITPFNVKETSHIIERVLEDLPKGSVLLSVVDPGVGTKRKAIALKVKDRYCVGPDNGSFTRILDSDFSCYTIENPKYMYKYPPSNTFHGRDIFAAAAAYLDKGIPIEEFGKEIKDVVKLDYPPANVREGIIESEVAYIDGFGNIETTLKKEDIERAKIGNHFEVNGMKAILGTAYAQTEDNTLLAHFDSSGYLEISVNKGNAAKLLNLSCCNRITLKNTDKQPFSQMV
ncbi:SAM hydrolase/SAM-dependent halogenase family protein [Mesoaciditoga sp.]